MSRLPGSSPGLLPLDLAFPTVANAVVVLEEDRPILAINALLAALVAPPKSGIRSESVYLDLARVTLGLKQISSAEDYNVYRKTALAILTSVVEKGAADPMVLEPFRVLPSRDCRG